jgi:CheY-like chemotaxis protein
VVIVDDDAGMRRLVADVLASGRYWLLEAADGDAAWALVRAHRPAVVVSDVIMPGRSGAELVRAIRAEPGLAATHVILVSGAAADADVAAMRSCGADRLLPKPFSAAALARAVAEGIAGGRGGARAGTPPASGAAAHRSPGSC